MDRAPRLERTALVVDDDVFVVSAIAELLSEDGYDVHTASNGFSALRRAAEVRPAVILLDLVMPERSGRDVLAELRSEPGTRDLAVVIVTGYADQLTESDLGAIDGLVIKPFELTELLGAVEMAVQRAAGRQPEVVPVAAVGHRAGARERRASGVGRTHGRF